MRSLRPGIIAVIVVGVAIIALGVLFFLNNQGGSSVGTGQAGQYAFR